jgi:hypothetical protein
VSEVRPTLPERFRERALAPAVKVQNTAEYPWLSRHDGRNLISGSFYYACAYRGSIHRFDSPADADATAERLGWE